MSSGNLLHVAYGSAWGEFAAAQPIAEALSTQACGGWQIIDEEVSTDMLVVFKGAESVLVDMRPCDLASLLD